MRRVSPVKHRVKIADLAGAGIRILKPAMTWPLVPETALELSLIHI